MTTSHALYPHRPPMIIELGLPTLMDRTPLLATYFVCNDWRVAHWRCGETFCGLCFLDFIKTVAERYGRLHETHDASAELRGSCGDYDVFSQIDYEPGAACVFPQVNYLHTIIRSLPSACFVLNTRPLDRWLKSVHAFPNSFRDRLLDSCPIYPRCELCGDHRPICQDPRLG